MIGLAGGSIQSGALNHALIKNYSIVGLHWCLCAQKDPALVRECREALCHLARQGLIDPLLVSERLTLDKLADGVQPLADGVRVGRVRSTTICG